MARPSKGEVNVSEAIRNFLETNKDVGPTAAAEAISKQVGKIVSPTYVSNIKSTMNRGNKKAPKAKKAGRKKTRVASVARAQLEWNGRAKDHRRCKGINHKRGG